MVHYCRLNVHDKCIRVASPSEGTGRLYLAISIYILHCPLCPRLYYRFAKLTFLWWNNGVAKRDGLSEGGGGGNAKCQRVKAGERAREDQFDVNRSIVIQVNRLPHCSPPNTIHNICIVVFYSLWNKSGREECRCCNCLLRVYDHLPRGTRSDFSIADDGKWKAWGSFERMRLIYLELRAY